MAIPNCSKPTQISIVLITVMSFTSFSYLLLQTRALNFGFNSPCRGEISNLAPDPITTTFDRIHSLEDLSEDGDDSWFAQASTPKGGFLRVRRNDTVIENWGISVFHALHCLGIVRDALRSLDHSHTMATRNTNPHKHMHGQDMEHTMHCLSYLAQTVACAGDDTIEPPKEHYNSNGDLEYLNVDGLGYRHQCKDITYIRDVVEKSEQEPLLKWDWEMGQTVQSVFGMK